MKKLILAILVLCGSYCLAGTTYVWRSSNTSTADSQKNLCNAKQGNTNAHSLFHGVIVSSGDASGLLTIYNSSATTTETMAVIDNGSLGSYFFDIFASSGLTYTKTGKANITILYDCY